MKPPFVELVACLRQIDTSLTGTYLDEELELILGLYRQIVESPGFKIDLDAIDLRRFGPAFRTTLRALFGKNIGAGRPSENELSEQESESAHQQLEAEQRRYRHRLNMQRYRKKYRQKQLSFLSQPATTPEEFEFKQSIEQKRIQNNIRRRVRYRQQREERERPMVLLESARANEEQAPRTSGQSTALQTPIDHPIQVPEIPQHESQHSESVPPMYSQPDEDVAQLATRRERIVIPTTSFPSYAADRHS